MINLKDIIKNTKKYHYIKFTTKPIKYISSDEKQSISLKINEKLIFIKLKPLTKNTYNKEKKSIFKTTGGPLYCEIFQYSVMDGKVIKDKTKLKNKVYFPKKYISSKLKKHKTYKWLQKDIIKVAKMYYNDKLNQGLVAINKITDF